MFVQHTLSEDRADMRERNKINSSKKVASHRTGQGGYRTAIPKWEKMEKDLIEKGITPATLHWPKRAKWYFFAHGGTLDQVTGALIPSDALRAAAERLEAALKLKAEGKFTPNRQKDELTYALGTPEHTGRVRGLGVVPWKHGFSEDLETYRSRCRSKAEQDEKFRALEERLSATEERVARLTGQEISLHCNVLIMFYSDLVADAAHLLTLISSLQVKKSRRSAPPPMCRPVLLPRSQLKEVLKANAIPWTISKQGHPVSFILQYWEIRQDQWRMLLLRFQLKAG